MHPFSFFLPQSGTLLSGSEADQRTGKRRSSLGLRDTLDFDVKAVQDVFTAGRWAANRFFGGK